MEQPEAYSAILPKCTTLEQLQDHVRAYEEIARDAVRVVGRMTQADFVEWYAGLKKERRGVFAGEHFAEKYGAVLMPNPMFKIAMIAEQYKVPFGVAHQRLKDVRPDLLEESPVDDAVAG